MQAKIKGFSLIESLISVAVLATGLLGLAQFQASLSKNAVSLYANADARLLGGTLIELEKTAWLEDNQTIINNLTPENGSNLTARSTSQSTGALTTTQAELTWATLSTSHVLTLKTHTHTGLQPADSRWLLSQP